MLVVPCGLVVGFIPKFSELRIIEVVGSDNMVGWLDVYSLDCAHRSCSSKLAI